MTRRGQLRKSKPKFRTRLVSSSDPFLPLLVLIVCTAAEAFHSFREVRTAHWHRARQEIAQGFLDRFVRQVSDLSHVPPVFSLFLPRILQKLMRSR